MATPFARIGFRSATAAVEPDAGRAQREERRTPRAVSRAISFSSYRPEVSRATLFARASSTSFPDCQRRTHRAMSTRSWNVARSATPAQPEEEHRHERDAQPQATTRIPAARGRVSQGMGGVDGVRGLIEEGDAHGHRENAGQDADSRLVGEPANEAETAHSIRVIIELGLSEVVEEAIDVAKRGAHRDQSDEAVPEEGQHQEESQQREPLRANEANAARKEGEEGERTRMTDEDLLPRGGRTLAPVAEGQSGGTLLARSGRPGSPAEREPATREETHRGRPGTRDATRRPPDRGPGGTRRRRRRSPTGSSATKARPGGEH